MVILNLFFAFLAAKWIIESEKYSFAWFLSGTCFVFNTLAVLTHLEQIF
jgi:hypothetical protein